MLFNTSEDNDYHDTVAGDGSQFELYLTQIVNDKINDGSMAYDSFEIIDIEVKTAQARLYNDDTVEWGKVVFSFYKDND